MKRIFWLPVAAAVVMSCLAVTVALAATAARDPYHARGPVLASVDQTGTAVPGKIDYYYLWVSRAGKATVNITPASGMDTDHHVYMYRYFAGYEDYRITDSIGVGVPQSVVPGLYFIGVSGNTTSTPYTLRVASSVLTRTQPVNGARPQGLVRVSSKQGLTKASAVALNVNYDYAGVLGRRDTDWFRFRVLSASDVWVGCADGGAIVVGELVDSRLRRLASLRANTLTKRRLPAGTYYVKWHWAPGWGNTPGGTYRFGVAGSKVRPR